MTHSAPTAAAHPAAPHDPRQQTLASFDYQWKHLPTGDFMPGDPWFDANATRTLARELCAVDPAWFRGKRVLDAGCGQGRWTRVLLELGAIVTAVDYSEAGLERTREVAGPTDRLTTRRVNLLDVPSDLAAQPFDFVFSFGVLHHTGDTWKALDNVASFVGAGGGMFLYLYGATSWSDEERRKIETLREQLAHLPFDAKIAELRRRFPGDDPHQLFDLLSPVINDRVHFDDLATRLRSHGFDSVTRTIDHSEIYARATRPGFPPSALLRPVGGDSPYLDELRLRFDIRRGAAAEEAYRSALRGVERRSAPEQLGVRLRGLRQGSAILDASLPPDRVEPGEFRGVTIDRWEDGSLLRPDVTLSRRFDEVLFLGAALGAGRFPRQTLRRLAGAVRPRGALVLELPEFTSESISRTVVDKLRDARLAVPEKVAAMLARRPHWTTGHALFALGGASLLNALPVQEVESELNQLGFSVRSLERTSRSTRLIVAERVA